MIASKHVESFIKETGIKLLGQVPVSEDEYRELIKYIRVRITTLSVQTIIPPELTTSLALVQIAIRRYEEGNYWDCFLDEIGMDVSSNKRILLGKIFAKTIHHYGLYELQRDTDSKYAYVENIKAHSFVPNNYLSGYFDFLLSFYEGNLLRQLDSGTEDSLFELIDFLDSTTSNNNDSVRIEKLGTRPPKAYRLLKATRCAIAECPFTVISDLLLSHLKLIDDYYYDNKLPNSCDRIAVAFTDWAALHAESFSVTKGQKKRTTGKAFFHKPHFDVDRSSGTVYLVVPEQKFREEDFSGVACATIQSVNERYRIQLNPYRAIGVIVTEPTRIKVASLFKNYTIEIRSGTVKAFSIPNKGYRIFDADFEESSRLHCGQNYLLTEKGAMVTGTSSPVYINHNYAGWDEYSFSDITEESVIYINGRPISTTDDFAIGAAFEFVSKEYDLYLNGKPVQTAYRHPVVSFKVQKASIDGVFLWCNKDRYHLGSIPHTVISLPEDDKNYGVTVRLDELLSGFPEDYYVIILDEPGKTPVIICKYAYLTGLRCNPEKRRFIFRQYASVYVTSGYNLEPLNCQAITDCEYQVDLTRESASADFALSCGEQTFTLKVPLKVFQYGFEKKYHILREKYIWYTEVRNELYIKMPGANEAKIFLGKNESDTIPGIQIEEGVFKFDISDFVRKIVESKSLYHYINLKYHDNQWRKLSVYKVLKRLQIDKKNVVFKDNAVYVDVSYSGRTQLGVAFTNHETQELILERTLENGETLLPELDPKSLYDVEYYELLQDDFGFSSEKKTIVKQFKVGAIDFSDISNCRINIAAIINRGRFLPLEYLYSFFVVEKESDNRYRGNLTEKKKNSPVATPYLSHTLSNSTWIRAFYDDQLFQIISIKTEYEGDRDVLFYDKKTKKLLLWNSGILSRSKEYDRFIPLFSDETEYQVELRRVK